MSVRYPVVSVKTISFRFSFSRQRVGHR